MITVGAAKALVKQHLPTPVSIKVPLREAYGLRVASDLYAPLSLPPFVQSSVDGYAIRFQDLKNGVFKLIGEVAAGDHSTLSLEENTTIRIMTGAEVPVGADTVVMQEQANTSSEGVSFNAENLKIGQNVRPVGSDIQKGQLILEKGQILSPAAAGYFSSFGLTEIEVFKKPSVTILTTGNEVTKPGEPLQPGKIYNSNQDLLCAALKEWNSTPIDIAHILDEPELIFQQIQNALHKSDIILISGGVSVGTYDYVVPLLEKAGVTKIFHGVKQKPGKPLFFGTLGSKLIFGLPGNPGSTLTCFYEYVTMDLQLKDTFTTALPLKNQFQKKSGLTHFLKGVADEGGVEVLSGQDSYMLHSYAIANCLVCIPEDKEMVNPGELVNVRII
jgi:molybdopterin molybdotransferase